MFPKDISGDANPFISQQTPSPVLLLRGPESRFTAKVTRQGGKTRALTSSVVPDPVVGQLHCVGVLGLLEVFVSVSTHVPATAYVPTY